MNGKTDAGSGDEDVVHAEASSPTCRCCCTPRPRRVLVIGWGAGATAASAALYPLESLECVEIEPAVCEAAPFFAELSGALRDDPRFRIAFRDGRNHLLRARERLGRDRLGAVEPLDLGGLEPLHPRVPRGGARAGSPRAGSSGSGSTTTTSTRPT